MNFSSFYRKYIKKEYLVFIFALLLGLAALMFYIFSGQRSYDTNIRELKNSSPEIGEVTAIQEIDGDKTLQVKCRDGSSYDVYYPQGEQDYSSLSASKCQQ